MQQLPKGYYAVAADFENAAKDSFTYKGVTYAVTEGVNLFGTIHEADAAACETPETVLDGVSYEAFEAPVILLSAGLHKIDKFRFTGSRYVLGEGEGVSPNEPSDDSLAPPALAAARADEEKESLLKGGYDYGTMYVNAPVSLIVFDGVSMKNARFCDSRTTDGKDTKLYFRNIRQISPCGKTLHYFSPQRNFTREVYMEHVRLQEFDDLVYGGIFVASNGGAEKLVIDDLCYDTTEQLFGFSNMARSIATPATNVPHTSYEIKNSYFRNACGENGIATVCAGIEDRAFSLDVCNCTFVDASRRGEAVFQPDLPSAKCTMTVRDCRFVDTRGNKVAISYRGDGEGLSLQNCTFEGYTAAAAPVPVPPVKAPARIKAYKRDWMTDTEDAHRVIGTNRADFTALDVRYENKKAYYCDQHTHTKCGGTSDGTYPMDQWVATMDELQLDFAIVVDHRQMRGFFLPEWDTDRFVYGTEPGGGITDMNAIRPGSVTNGSFHYNMLFRDKHDLALVLANFPEFKFKGDRLTGKFGYPKFTRERFDELVAYIHSIGGMMVHPHPATLMASYDPLDYYFGERTYLETLYGTCDSHASFRNYALWLKILDAGKHMLTAGGSDTHGRTSNAVVSTMYCEERTGTACFDCMKSGDYTVGGFGIKMCIDGKPMGSELAYREGMKLTLRIDDYFAPRMRDNTAYELRIYTDRGLAYASMFSGKEKQAISLEVQHRRFYRAEVFDLTHECRVAVGNPIWLDKTE